MVEIISAPGFTDLFSNGWAIASMVAGVIIIAFTIYFIIKEGLPALVAGIMVVAVGSILPLAFMHKQLEKQNYKETLDSIEETYGVKFSSQQRQFKPESADYRSLIVPSEDDFLIVPNVRIMGTEEVYEVMVTREDNMLTLLVPKFEGSKEYVELEVAE